MVIGNSFWVRGRGEVDPLNSAFARLARVLARISARRPALGAKEPLFVRIRKLWALCESDTASRISLVRLHLFCRSKSNYRQDISQWKSSYSKRESADGLTKRVSRRILKDVQSHVGWHHAQTFDLFNPTTGGGRAKASPQAPYGS